MKNRLTKNWIKDRRGSGAYRRHARSGSSSVAEREARNRNSRITKILVAVRIFCSARGRRALQDSSWRETATISVAGDLGAAEPELPSSRAESGVDADSFSAGKK